MLLAVKNEIAKPLSMLMLFNRSIQEMVFPDQWKIAHVIALFKKGDKSLASNYRPVSLLSCVSKILEKIVYKQIYNHLHIKPEGLKSRYRSPGYKKNQLVLCKNYVLQW